jgi:NADH-quinone oxidoreductase subunit A
MLSEFTGVGLMLAAAVALGVALLAANRLLAPRRASRTRSAPVEPGERRFGAPAQRARAREPFVAMTFVVLALQTLWFLPWAALFRDLGWFGFGAMAVFAVPLVLGLIYQWRKRALEW